LRRSRSQPCHGWRKAFFDGAKSWSRVGRIIARIEAGEQGTDTRFIVTNLAGCRPKMLYEDLYCRLPRLVT
jgi:hypothetical protein